MDIINLKNNDSIQAIIKIDNYTIMYSYQSICVIIYKGYYFFTCYRNSRTTSKYIRKAFDYTSEKINEDIQEGKKAFRLPIDGYKANFSEIKKEINKILGE